MSKWDILRINLAAGLIAGALIGTAEIVISEFHAKARAKALVADLTDIGDPPPTQSLPETGSGE